MHKIVQNIEQRRIIKLENICMYVRLFIINSWKIEFSFKLLLNEFDLLNWIKIFLIKKIFWIFRVLTYTLSRNGFQLHCVSCCLSSNANLKVYWIYKYKYLSRLSLSQHWNTFRVSCAVVVFVYLTTELNTYISWYRRMEEMWPKLLNRPPWVRPL